MRAILVKYIPCSNTKAAYMKAYDTLGHSITIPIDDDLPRVDLYRKAAEKFCEKMGWEKVDLIQGSLKTEEVFVLVEKHPNSLEKRLQACLPLIRKDITDRLKSGVYKADLRSLRKEILHILLYEP